MQTDDLAGADPSAIGVGEGASAHPSPIVELSARREARLRRRAVRREAAGDAAAASTRTEPGAASAPSSREPNHLNAPMRENRHRHRPRAPRAERQAAQAAGPVGAEEAGTAARSPVGEGAAVALVTSLPDAKGRSGARIAARARKRQQVAASAVDGATDNPAVGALNRHLNVLMQQVMTAHRVIGRTAAEREALRQQLADLQGIPVDEIVVSSIAAASETATRSTSATSAAPPSASRFAKLNYFGGDDFDLVRKRRMTLAAIIMAIGLIFTVVGPQLGLSLPTDLSRESLTLLPLLGPLMTLFLAGWVLFRIARVFGRVLRWVYPAENARRRRR